MWLSKYFVYFTIFSFMGWVYESIYCTVRSGKWENRGFLYGPICPIYGAGGTGLAIVLDIFAYYGVKEIEWWKIFIISYIGSVILEYVTSYVLEKIFHAYWWDYSEMPLNINGRVCVPYSIAFGFAGILVVNVIIPFTEYITVWMGPITYEFVGLFFMAIIAADTTLTISALTHFELNVIALEESLNTHMESFVIAIQERGQSNQEPVIEAATDEREKERERFSKESIAMGVAAMGVFTRAAIRRVKGFRSPKPERQGIGERIFSSIKNSANKFIVRK